MITSDRLVAGLLFVAVAAIACFSPAQGDTWWHLRVGQDIWQSHSVSLVDAYSYTAAGRTFPNHEWLTQLIFYGLYRAGGMPLLEATCAGAIVLSCALAWGLVAGRFEVKLVAFLALFATSTMSWALRPQAFSMAALMITVWLLSANRVRLLPVVFLVWANLHGAVALGILAVLAALFSRTFRERHLPPSLTFAAVGCVLASGLTPLRLRYWPEILKSLVRSHANNLIEWRAPDFGPQLWPFWAMAVALPCLAVVFRRRSTSQTWTFASVALVLLPLALRSVRNVPMFMLAAVPAVVALTREEKSEIAGPKVRREHTALNAVFLGFAAAVGSLVAILAWSANAPVLGWRPLSDGAVAAISRCPDPLYNTYENGGALIWFVPGKRVFIDNRQDPYPSDLLSAARQTESDGLYQALFARYGFRCAVVPSESPTADNLRLDTDWTVSYAGQDSTVFIRR